VRNEQAKRTKRANYGAHEAKRGINGTAKMTKQGYSRARRGGGILSLPERSQDSQLLFNEEELLD